MLFLKQNIELSLVVDDCSQIVEIELQEHGLSLLKLYIVGYPCIK